MFQDTKDPSEHTLEVDFMHAYDKSLVEDYTVKVVLPEGAKNIRIELPSEFKVDSIEMGKFFGTLDFFGRPQITINKKNAVHELLDHNIRVRYQFNNTKDLYLDPLCLFGIFFAVFAFGIIYSRLEFDLEKFKPKTKQS